MLQVNGFVDKFQDSITPSGGSRPSATVYTPSTFGQTLLQNLATKLNWTDDQKAVLNNTYIYTFFALGSVSGFVNVQADQSQIPQILISTATVLAYLEYMVTITSSMKGFVDEVKAQLDSALQGNVNQEAIQSANISLAGFAQFDIAISIFFDAEIPNIKEVMEIAPIKDQINQFYQGIVSFANQTIAIINTSIQGGDYSSSLQEFNALHSAINQIIDVLIQSFEQTKGNLQKYLVPMFSEQEYAEFTEFLKGMTKLCASLVFDCQIFCSYNESTSLLTLQVLQFFAKYIYTIDSKLTALMRFTGNYEEYIKEVKDSYEEMGKIFEPLLKSLINSSELIPNGFKGIGDNLIVQTFTQLQKSFNDFPNKLVQLTEALKKDRRFSIYSTVKDETNSNITQEATQLIENTTLLASQLLNDEKTDLTAISQTMQKIQSTYTVFMQYFVNTIEAETDANTKQHYTQQKDLINSTMTSFAESFAMYSQSTDNALFRAKAGVLASKFALATLSLDHHPVIIQNLAILRPVIASSVITFFSNNLKIILELLTLMYQRSTSLDPNTKTMFETFFPIVMKVLQDATPKFLSSSDSHDPQNVITCLHEIDKITSAFTGILAVLAQCELEELKSAKTLLEIFNSTLQLIAEAFRQSIQTSFDAYFTDFVLNINQFTLIADSSLSLQSDEIYNQFLQNKSLIESTTKESTEIMKSHPPIGIFDKGYLTRLIQNVKQLGEPIIFISNLFKDTTRTTNDSSLMKTSQGIVSSFQGLIKLNAFKDATEIATLDIQSIQGLSMKNTVQQITPILTQLVQGLQSNPSSTPAIARQATELLYNLAATLDQNSNTTSQSETIRQLAKILENSTCAVALGDSSQQNYLVQAIQTIANAIQQITPLSEAYIQTMSQIAPAQAAPQTSGFDAVQAQKKLDETGEIVDATGKPIAGLQINQIPTENQVNDIFMKVNSDPNLEAMRGPLGSVINSLKNDVINFKALMAQYNQSPSQQLLDQLNVLGTIIQQTLGALQLGIAIDKNTTIEAVQSQLQQIQLKGASFDELSHLGFLVAVYINNSSLSKELQKVLLQLVTEALADCSSNPSLTLNKLLAVIQSLISDPALVLSDILSQLKTTIQSKNSQLAASLIPKLLVMEKIVRASNPDTAAQIATATASIRQTLTQYQGKGDNLTDADFAELLSAISQFENAIYNSSQAEDEIPDNQISDTVMDLSQEVTSLIASLVILLKKATTAETQQIQASLEQIRSKSISLLTATLQGSSHRGSNITKDDANELCNEISKLLENLELFQSSSLESLSSSNKASLIRGIGKTQRELTVGLSTISSLCDTIIELTPENHPSYGSDVFALLYSIIKLNAVVSAKDENSKNVIFKAAHPVVLKNFDIFKQRATSMIQGTDSESAIAQLIAALETELNSFNATTLTYEQTRKAFTQVADLRSSLDDALNTDITPDTASAAKLPFRFAVISAENTNPRPIQELKAEIDANYTKVSESLSSFITVLNNTKVPSQEIVKALLSYHDCANKYLLPAEVMRYSIWNPASQSRLLSAHTNLVQVGDIAIDAARARLIADDQWRQKVSQFNSQAQEAHNAIKAAAEAAYSSAQQDLSATNEAERELIAAAQSIQKSQSRLVSFKSQAQEQQATKGSTYIGVDIIDVSAPILNSAAKLVEAAQAQTKYVLQRQPDLTNTKGLVNTARNLVDSLELLLIAAEAIVNNDADAISKVLAACNLISSAIAHFVAECRQKDGSPELNEVMSRITEQIQETIKHVRAFGEAAQKKQSEEAQQTKSGRPARGLNSMIEKLNAEAKVVEARKLLEEAENNLKRTRQNK